MLFKGNVSEFGANWANTTHIIEQILVSGLPPRDHITTNVFM